MEKVLVAMSGGVDSAVTAGLLREQGYEVGGATMVLRPGGEKEAQAAREVAEKLGIPFWQMDLQREFEELVIRPFCQVYQQGGTPNPCVICNYYLKFGLFLEKALEIGFDKMATGHYARAVRDPKTGRSLIYQAADRKKDQTYMLAGLRQDQLARALFPLGELTKDRVRQKAEELGLPVAHKHDSQDICFIPDGDYLSFLKQEGVIPQPGRFRDAGGRDYGPHKGFEAYTIGQRRGLELALGSRTYVVDKWADGSVIVGPPEALMATQVEVEQVNYLPFDAPDGPMEVEAKLRYTPNTASCVLYPEGDGCRLEFREPQRAVTPGQQAVFYADGMLLGGGRILRGR